MKHLKYLTFFIFSGIIFYSCKKDDPKKDNSTQAYPTNNMTATIGGQNMIFTARTNLYTNNYQGATRTLGIVAVNRSSATLGYQLEFNINNYNLNYLGTYSLGSYNSHFTNSCAIYEFGPYIPDASQPNYQEMYYSDSVSMGSITITSFNQSTQTISGVFNFMGYQYQPNVVPGFPDSTNITNGSFYAILQQVP